MIYASEIIRTSSVGRDYREHEGAGQPKRSQTSVSLLFSHILAISIRHVSSIDSNQFQSVIKAIRLMPGCLARHRLSVHGLVRW